MEEKRSIWWKIYFYLLVILTILIIPLFFLEGDKELCVEVFGKNIFEVIYSIFIGFIYFVSLIGIFGFVYSKKIFYKEFWKYIFFIELVNFIGSFVLDSDIDTINLSNKITILFILMYFIFIFLYFLSLYLYSFRMNEFWKSNE